MSQTRGSATARASDALRDFADAPGSLIVTGRGSTVAEAVVAAVYPEITDAKQMLGVPEGSILIHPIQGGLVRPLIWEDHELHTRNMAYKPDWLIDRYGPLTVVWMP